MRHQRLIYSGLIYVGLGLLLGCAAEDTSRSADTDSVEQSLRGGRHRGSIGRHSRHHRGRGHGHGHGHGKAGSGSSSGGAAGSGMSGAAGGGAIGGGTSAGTGGGSAGVGGGFEPVCGNGIPEWDEQCDDGNVQAQDGCNASCMLEPGFTCPDLGMPCRAVVCGDTLIDWYTDASGNFVYEECDDGNASAGDGCDSTCTLEPDWTCPAAGEPCRPIVCGDGNQDFRPGTGGESGSGGAAGMGAGAGTGGGSSVSLESCDDGNTTSGDGCDASCELEPGWLCTTPAQACRQPACGDGFQDFIPGAGGSGGAPGEDSGGSAGTGGGSSGGVMEQCDDGNALSGDGCDASCNLESGWICEMPAQPCREPRCGDGMLDWFSFTFEECDDGNAGSGDGCSSSCALEPGWVCGAPAEPCRQPRCGDGFQDFLGAGGTGGGSAGAAGSGGSTGGVSGSGGSSGEYEQCDDGNLVAGDGCNAICEEEPGWHCWGQCFPAMCGDGFVDAGEECDDGNIIANDGCVDCRVP